MKLALLCIALASPAAYAGEIKVAAAADLKFALDEIVHQYQQNNPEEKVEVTYGASGKFVTQIKEGAPFDLFFSADTEKAEEVQKNQKTSGPLFPYAHGHLALWVKNESPLKLDANLRCLLDPAVRKIAVANPVAAPYGKIARQALEKSGLAEKVAAKLVTGENISQTAQFAESGAADIGLIAKSLALSPALQKEGRFVEVNPALYPPLTQMGVILKGAHEAAAKKFKDYFFSQAGRKILTQYGLTL